ncbi:MAG: lamin tail domain-containing protein [Acidimicrobiia bacterium]
MPDSSIPRWCLLVLAVACAPDNSPGTEIGPSPEADLPIVDLFANVTSVADGDSFRAVVDGEEMEVRLLGVNAPERDECYGPEAAVWLSETIDGKEVGLAVAPEPDQFDRILAVAVVDRINLNLASLSSGHALVVSADGIDRSSFVAAEDEARAAAVGMWADDICGAAGPRATLGIETIDFDPPGPDEVETVTIVNSGAEDIDLDGFILRDESSVNRFEFPSLLLAQGESVTVTVSDCRVDQSVTNWCSEQPVFNNDGDAALVVDPFGRVVALARY